jgi:translin
MDTAMPRDSPSSADRGPAAPAIAETTLAGIDAHLKQRELRREDLYQRARRLRRGAQLTMTRLHSDGDVAAAVAEIRRELAELSDWVRREARGDEPLALDALQEGVEAILLGAVVAGSPIPGPAELGVDPEPYLLGLGDLIGEIRRLALESLGRGDLDTAEQRLRLMEELTADLLRFDTTRAIVQLKPKQDQARALVERTRGDVVMARWLARAAPPPPREGA